MRRPPKIESKVDPRTIVLDEDWGRHNYTVRGRPCPGVTTILWEEGLMGPGALFSHDREAALRGRAVHRAAYLHLAGTLDVATVHPLVRPYLDQFFGWVGRRQPRALASEMLVGYPAPAFCGRLDLVATLYGARLPELIDLKTTEDSRAIPSWVRWQLAGYSLCLTRPVRRGVLLLDGTDRPAEVKYLDGPEYRGDAGVFLAAATVWTTKAAVFGTTRRGA